MLNNCITTNGHDYGETGLPTPSQKSCAILGSLLDPIRADNDLPLLVDRATRINSTTPASVACSNDMVRRLWIYKYNGLAPSLTTAKRQQGLGNRMDTNEKHPE